MRSGPSITGVIIFLIILFLVDLYVYSGVKTMTVNMLPRTRKVIHWIYWIVNSALFVWFLSLFLFLPPEKGMPRAFMTFMGVWLMFFVPKLVMVAFLGAEDLYRGVRAVIALVFNATNENKSVVVGISRREFISRAAAFTAAVPFLGIIHGMASGKFRFRVRKETLYFPDLPSAFDGFTITQLSDIHSGSWDPQTDRPDVLKGLQLAADQKSDLFVFTGDLVNNIATEMDPWKKDFNVLKGKYGQFSILGNHDYGDYVPWDSKEEKSKNFEALINTHAEAGFRLLRNEHTVIERDGEKLYLIGVENWGTGGFVKHGDLDKALQGVPADGFKVLLSHDPSHFDNIVQSHPTHVHLTLSGHTHGAQFGVEVPGLRFSPVQFRYEHWAGLYKISRRFLYVNRGFGFLAFPGRVGIWPEVTVLTLRRGTSGIEESV